MSTILWGCDGLSHEPGNGAETSTTWRLADGRTIEVILDDTFISDRRRFYATEEGYHKHVDALLEQTSIRVNADLWHTLKHGNNPAEISLLNANGRIAVGKYTYRFDKEGIYQQRSDDSAAKPELVFYYGLSGDEDYQEFVRAARAYSGADVSIEEFKNPFAKEMVAEALELRKAEKQRFQKAQTLAKSAASCSTWTGSNSRDFGECFASSPTDFPYGTSSILPSGYDRSAGPYDVRGYMINQSYRSGLKKKAYGATQISIRKSGSGDPFFGLTESSCPTYDVYEPSGSIFVRRTGDYFSVEVKVESDPWETARCEVSDNASRSGGAQSKHTAEYTDIYFLYWDSGNPIADVAGPYSIMTDFDLP